MSKKIVVELNKQSVQNAISRLNDIKSKIPKMMQDLLDEIYHWVKKTANYYVDHSDIGDNVKEEIKSKWSREYIENGIRIINSSRYAVFIEFGVGKVGEYNPHPEAQNQGYEYNVPSPHKYSGQYHDEFTWRFYAKSEEDVDLREGSYESWDTNSGYKKIITQGSYGVFYAFNALVDLRNELTKSNGGIIGKMWEDIKERYIS